MACSNGIFEFADGASCFSCSIIPPLCWHLTECRADYYEWWDNINDWAEDTWVRPSTGPLQDSGTYWPVQTG